MTYPTLVDKPSPLFLREWVSVGSQAVHRDDLAVKVETGLGIAGGAAIFFVKSSSRRLKAYPFVAIPVEVRKTTFI